jgi:hypothetical protein
MTAKARDRVLRSSGRLRLPADLKREPATNSVVHFCLSPPVQFRMSLDSCPRRFRLLGLLHTLPVPA